MTRRRWSRLRWACAALLALSLIVLAAETADARGGGGGGYGGGGDGGGGDGDWGWVVEIVVWLLFEYPTIGLPTLVVVAVLIFVASRKGRNAYQGSVIRRGGTALVGNRRAEAIAALRARDPAFDEARFLDRARVAFRKVQAAWCSHDLSAMRAFVSDGIHERFSLQTKEQQELGYRDRMDDLDVLGADYARMESQGPFDAVTVWIKASAKDYRVSLADGKKIRGTDLPETFMEYWTFRRRKGKTTTAGKPGLIEGSCPNCGAAIEMNAWDKCRYCKAMLRSGEFDWVLVEITQAVEWKDAPSAAIPGAWAMTAVDPGFDPAHLEDRASVMFYRWTAATKAGGIAPLRKMASPEFLERFAADLRRRAGPDVVRRWWGECAVGSVDTVGVAKGETRDLALVEVRWQGTSFSAAAGGAPARGARGVPTRTLFSLSRKAGVASDPGTSVSSAHCPSCGAPEEGGDSDACAHCGEVLNDGSRGWVVDGVFSSGSPEAHAARGAVLGAQAPAVVAVGAVAVAASIPPAKPAAIAWMARVMTADGAADAKERAVLERVAARAGMRAAEVEALLSSASRDGEGAPAAEPADAYEARAWLDPMAEIALADGRVDPAERRVLLDVGRKCGLAAVDVERALGRARQRLYLEAKSELRRQSSRE